MDAAPRDFEAAAGLVHYNNVPAGGPAHTDQLGLNSILRGVAHAQAGDLSTPSAVRVLSNSTLYNIVGVDLRWSSFFDTQTSLQDWNHKNLLILESSNPK